MDMQTLVIRMLVPAMALTALEGCGGEPKQLSVTGTVSFNGKPLEDGTIEFTSDSGAGLPVGSMITQGRYELPNPPGLAAATYLVRINSRGGTREDPDAPPDLEIAAPDSGEQIPRQYNEETMLRAVVAADGPNTFSFELTGSRREPQARSPAR